MVRSYLLTAKEKLAVIRFLNRIAEAIVAEQDRNFRKQTLYRIRKLDLSQVEGELKLIRRVKKKLEGKGNQSE